MGYKFIPFKRAVSIFTAFFLLQQGAYCVVEPSNSVIFLKQATQDLYEAAVANLLKNDRLSEKYIDKCLEAEPLNDQCQFLKLNLQHRRRQLEDVQQMDALSLKIVDQDQDMQFYKLIKELEKKIEIKNYSYARQLLDKLEKDYPDYPDLIIFKRNLNYYSSENDTEDLGLFQRTDSKAYEIYKKRCESIDPMTIRKYIYDLDFCIRKQAM